MSLQSKILSFTGFVVVLCLAIVFRQRSIPSPQTLSVEDDCIGSDNYGANNNEEYGDVIGIEFGSTQSRVAVFKHNKFEIIRDDKGYNMTPSYVAFTEEGTLVGFDAKDHAASNPKNTIYDVRRLLGRRFSDPSLQNHINVLQYDVVDKKGKPSIKVHVDGSAKFFTPERISSKILEKLKQTAETYLGRKVKYAVIAVPAYFGDEQRQAIKNAGLMAGLIVLRVINEPTAAAIGHGVDVPEYNVRSRSNDRQILVYNLGAGDCDLTLQEVSDGAFDILSMVGDAHFGGEDFDRALLNYVVDQYNSKNNANVATDFKAMEILKYEVKKLEEALLTKPLAAINIEGSQNINGFSETVTQAQLRGLNRKLLEKALGFVEQVLQKVKLDKSEVDDIILTGSPVHTVKVQAFLETYFDGKKLHNSVGPDEAIVRGVAAQARILSFDSSDAYTRHDLTYPRTWYRDKRGHICPVDPTRLDALVTQIARQFYGNNR